MDRQDDFKSLGEIAVFRPTGEASFEEAVHLVTNAIIHAREHRIKKLMAVVTGLGGFESPALGQRYWMVNEWALAADRALSLAVVAKREHMDPQRVGVIIAEQIGFLGNAFESEGEALAWLQEIMLD